jgi:amino acid adenylation domain-containing protein
VLNSVEEIGVQAKDPIDHDGGEVAPAASPHGDDEAYLLFTSGSTGEPKGVPITHQGLADYITFAAHAYVAPGERTVAALFSALTFDLTITSLFVPLVTGGRTVVIGPDGPTGLATIADRRDITWLKATPSHLELLVRLLPNDHALRTLVVGGEAFGRSLAESLLAFNPTARIFNEYGPTEAVVGCMIYQVPDGYGVHWPYGPDVPIGRPAPGVSLVVLDRYRQPVPVGSPGELCISHRGVTAGYLDAAADKQGEVAGGSPFMTIDGTRFYQSGDLARLIPADGTGPGSESGIADHELVYLGRIDEQVKIGGIRLEPIEVEQALNHHPSVARSAVRVWSPSTEGADRPKHHCPRCGLPDNVPGVAFDDDGVCDTCHSFDRVAPVAEQWFKTSDDLARELVAAAESKTGDYDVLHLLSGGKDSTYALYQLVELGAKPYALTLDNGFISEEAKANVRSSVADLGVDHEFVTTEAMNAIFADSLATYSNVCNGCYKAIYTLATNKAAELGIPVIVTGLSRGQLFETRLIPQQFTLDRFDPDAIDRAVIEARRNYHRTDDAVSRLLDTEIFSDDGVFDRIRYVDFFRYVDVELSEMLEFLETRAPWVRPTDTGRSTNCLINAAGIHTHLTEQGYHNYAVPYAWDVRLGHKTRDEAVAELDDHLDDSEKQAEIADMLNTVGYEPHRREVLTAWLEPEPGSDIPDPSELREFLTDRLPDFAIPAAFVAIDQLPLNTNGKLDASALPAPQRVHRAASGVYVAASTDTETLVVSVWERVLGIEPISIDDDFFALGGDSLAALEMIVAISDRMGLNIPEDVAFRHTTPRTLALRIDGERGVVQRTDGEPSPPDPTPDGEVPGLSAGQRAVLFDQASRPDDVMYNVGRVYRFDGDGPEPERLGTALERVAERHQPLSWTYGAERRKLTGAEAVAFTLGSPIDPEGLDQALAAVHRAPFDLEHGPMLRVLVQPVSDGSTAVLLVIHHVSGDADSFDIIWRDVDTLLDNTLLDATDRARARLTPLRTDYARFCQWQEDTRSDVDRRYWLSVAPDEAPGTLAFAPGQGQADGFLIRPATVVHDDLALAASTVVGATPFALALTAIAPALADHGTSSTVELGLITSTRSHPAAADLVGYFLNTVPVIIDTADQIGGDSTSDDAEPVEDDGGADLRAHIATVTGRLGSALAHRTYPLAHILADRRSAGLPAQPPGVFVAYDDLTDAKVAGATARQRVLSNGSAVVDATIFVERRHDRVDLSLEYRGSTMTAIQAEQLLAAIDRSLTELVDGLLGHESTTVDDTDRSILVGPDLVQLDGPVLTIDVIEQRLDAGGDAPAVVCGDETLNWDELASRSNAVVRHLDNQGVKPGDRVVVSLGRSVDMVAAMIGVLRAGAVYVPVDTTYPRARIRLLTKRARAATVLSGYIDELYRVDPADDVAPGNDLSDTGVGRSPDDAAYIIFTSGSTGEPKPVAITHGQLSHSTKARPRFYGDPASDDDGVQFRFLMVSSPSFDSSIAGLFWTLAEGGTLVLPDDHAVHDVEALARLLVDRRITHTLMVPTLYQGVLDSLPRLGYGRQVSDGHWWPGQVIVAGEVCPSALVDNHYHRFPLSRLTNEYGPTEATVWATGHHTRLGDDPVPIGRPIAGTWLAVVGPDGRPRPHGVIGELALGGPTVAADHGDPSSELGSWVAEALPPASADGSVFRTGDRAAVVDGTVEFHGRHDHQLSVNGTRIEPEEVEHALSGVNGVRAVIVTSLGRGRRPLDLLVAHVEIEPVEFGFGGDPAAGDGDHEVLSALQDTARAHLPPLLRPGHYEIHRSDQPLPRTPNGKLDRAAAATLPVTEFRPAPGNDLGATSAGDIGAPWAELESKLAALFAATLGRDRVAVTESFFDFGGHSLLAIDLMLAIEEATGHRVPVSELYRAPTPQLLAAEIARGGSDGDAVTAQAGDRPERRGHTFLVPIQPDGSRPPIFGIHVLGVNSAYFRPLSSHLGTDQPVLGLGQPNLDRDLRLDGPTSVADVAAGYVAEINRIRPDGPIVIAAISLGGVVAYETAQQLVAMGRDVPLMALFDAVGPDVADHPLTRRQQLGIHARALKAEPKEYVWGRVAYQGQKVKRVAELAESRLRERYGQESTHRLEVRRFIEANIQSQLHYEYQPYPNPMVIYKAADDPFTAHFLDLDMGWRSVAHGGLIIKVVSGDHISMVAEPNVGLLARYLREDIDAHLPALQ